MPSPARPTPPRRRSCGWAQRAHSRQLDERLDPAEAQELQAHLASCPGCQRVTSAVGVTVDRLRSAAAPVHPERVRALASRVQARLAAVAPSSGAPRWPRLAPALAAGFLLVGGLALGILLVARPPQAVASPTLQELGRQPEELLAVPIDPRELTLLLASLDPALESARTRTRTAGTRVASLLAQASSARGTPAPGTTGAVDVPSFLALVNVVHLEDLGPETPDPGLWHFRDPERDWPELVRAIRSYVAARSAERALLQQAVSAIRALAPPDADAQARLDRLLPY